MGFLHLWAILAGVAAVAVPLAVHWLTWPRPLKVPLSTLRFVEEAVKQRRAHHRLRDALILAARMLAIACLALAFARPLLSAADAPEKAAAVERVVVLDVSASMGAVAHGVTSLERARGKAARYLEQENGLKADLVLAGAHAGKVFEHPSANLAALRDELGKATVRPEALNLAEALTKTGDLFAQGADNSAVRREVVIISDLQRTNWGAVDFAALPKDAHIIIESVAPAEPAANLAITNIRVRGRSVIGKPIPLEVDVANNSPAARTVSVAVQLPGGAVHLEKVCPANTVTTLSGEATFTNKGITVGEAQLVSVEDALAADNVRSFVIDVRAAPTFLLISRDGVQPRATSSHYLERALAPRGVVAGGAAPTERVVRIASAALDQQAVADADAVVLDQPGRLDGPAISLLANWLRRGKSILYVASDVADATNLQALTLQAGADLRMPVAFIPPSVGVNNAPDADRANRPAGSVGVRHDLRLADVRGNDPVWAVFGDNLQQTLDTLRFTARLGSRPTEDGIIDDLLASYSDRSAALVATACGQGTLIVWNADLADSNIVSSSAFVPLVGELTARMLSSRPTAATDGGEPIALSLPADLAHPEEIEVIPPTAPAGQEQEKGRVVDEHGGLIWRLDTARTAGVYRLKRNGVDVAAVAVAIPASEADLGSLSADVLTGRLAGGRSITVHTAAVASDGPDRAWVWLAVAAALALMSETVLLHVFKT